MAYRFPFRSFVGRLGATMGRGSGDTIKTFSRSSMGRSINFWNQDQWEAIFPSVLEAQVEKAGNAGQESILTGEFYNLSYSYLLENGEDYDPEDYVSYLQSNLSGTKYDAISIIIDECANELIEYWDDSAAGDGVGINMYLGIGR